MKAAAEPVIQTVAFGIEQRDRNDADGVKADLAGSSFDLFGEGHYIRYINCRSL